MWVVKEEESLLTERFVRFRGFLTEAGARCWAANEALARGRGGISFVARATGLSRTTIYAGMRELQEGAPEAASRPLRSRKAGGGRKTLTEKDPKLLEALTRLVDPVTRGDPESPLRWTAKSTVRLAEELTAQGHPVSQRTVYELLNAQGYSMQSLRKNREGGKHPDRNAQFLHINERAKAFIARGEPVISVDTKKKELVGDFVNKGREWQPKECPEEVRVHDFEDKKLGKVSPYGVYDLRANEGWVSVGTDHDTSAFAVESIRRWWRQMGQPLYPSARRLLITADGGGSNSSRARLWKVELQKLADDLGLEIAVSHFPPGTSKWNRIEHWMFNHISANWRGRPLSSHEVIINLIGSTTSTTGLKVRAELDKGVYPTGVKIPDTEFAAVHLKRERFHGEWNYSIRPSHPS